MFERRLKIILVFLLAVFAVIVVRLVDLQVVHAANYREQAERVLLRPAIRLPCVRGSILDRRGLVLAKDEPCWQVSVDYEVLSGDLTPATEEMWEEIARFSSATRESLRQRGTAVVDRVHRWKRAVSRARGYDVRLREEHMAHPVLLGLDDQRQIEARRLFDRFDCVKIEDGTRRALHAHPSLAHILGQLGSVSAKDLLGDPHAGDPRARLLPTDTIGISGVEYAAEAELRGRRGRLQYNLRGQQVDHTEAERGRDVSLTLNFELQRALYEMLEESLPSVAPDSPGGSIVVLHTDTREVLALVSYPGYDGNQFRSDYDDLRSDTRATPLRFRAVANCYEPGSIVKPLTCIAGLGTGVIDTATTFPCDGYFNRKAYPNAYRCWAIHGTKQRKRHGEVNVVEAVSRSCNVFMYNVAGAVGPNRLCQYFDMAGLGRTSGIGLREERDGINPTPGWLMQNRNVAATKGHARNFGIGQGEVVVTPLQAANLMATYATGVYQQVTLIQDSQPKPVWRLPVSDEAWSATREGLFGVTNDPRGTAYHTAHWTNSRYALCGKTGSATTQPTPTHYRIRYREESQEIQIAIVPAKVKAHAVKLFKLEHPAASFDFSTDVSVESVWPPPKPSSSGLNHSHAWFAGYLQPIGDEGAPLMDTTPPIAFSLMIEFGGSGGRTAGPMGRNVARIICRILGDDLDPNGAHTGTGT